MNYSKRVELFRAVRERHAAFLTAVLWKLTADRELFSEALQYSLLEMWRHVEKLKGRHAPAYIYRIALSANSKAWRNRVGKDAAAEQVKESANEPCDNAHQSELKQLVRRAVSELPAKQGRAIVMRYFEQADYGAVAEKLGCSKAGARSHVAKAIEALRKKLAALKVEVV